MRLIKYHNAHTVSEETALIFTITHANMKKKISRNYNDRF